MARAKARPDQVTKDPARQLGNVTRVRCYGGPVEHLDIHRLGVEPLPETIPMGEGRYDMEGGRYQWKSQ